MHFCRYYQSLKKNEGKLNTFYVCWGIFFRFCLTIETKLIYKLKERFVTFKYYRLKKLYPTTKNIFQETLKWFETF